MAITAKVKKSPTKAIKRIEALAKEVNKEGRVKVGLPADSGDYPDGTSTVMVGAVHEFGSPAQGIPERSFLRSTTAENRRKYKNLMNKLAAQIVSGKITKEKALELLGLTVTTDVKDKITSIKEPELTSREGNPLVLTGHLRRAITYQVNK